MTDVLTTKQRSACMSAIRGKNTKPELAVRSALHCLGFRYRLHRTDLPGKPDLVFPSLRKIIFVHGCFWHMHQCRYGRVVPATRTEFWQEKRKGNVKRDRRHKAHLRRAGWKVLEVWECWTKNPDRSMARILEFLQS